MFDNAMQLSVRRDQNEREPRTSAGAAEQRGYGNRLRACPAIVCLLVLLTSPAAAEVVRFEIERREPLEDGRQYGQVGSYERIAGRVYYAIDPALPQNQAIVDLDLAPRNDQGRVEFSADLYILAPKNPGKGNGVIFYDVNNRGNKLALRFLADAEGGNEPDDAGNGFLMREGYTVVWSGWDGELLPGDQRLQLYAPVARGRGDKPTCGQARYEIVVPSPSQRTNINRENHGAYRPTDQGLETATLTWRLRPGDSRVPIPREQFQLHITESDADESGQLPMVELELRSELQPGYLYELIYEAQDPLVHGVCFAAVRDLIAALKHGGGKNSPLLVDGMSPITHAYGFGVSQSGRFLREMLYAGFNQDERGKRVFDAMMPHVAGAGLGSFNYRFAQPSAYASQHEHHDWPIDRFPFSYTRQHDAIFPGVTYSIEDLPRKEDGILEQAKRTDTVPLVMHTQSSTEYWTRSGSLVHTDPASRRDVELPSKVRLYALGGTQHGPGDYPPKPGVGQTPANPADYRPLLRALLVALDQWVREGKEPPSSVYPRINEGTLVEWHQEATGFPYLPGVRYPEVIQQPAILELGPHWESRGIIDQQPPHIIHHYSVLVPKCDADGNEQDCLLPAEVAVPLATHTGWSLRSRQSGAENELVGLDGSYMVFPASEEDRQRTGDPRKALQARYGDIDGYLQRLEEHCRTMVEQDYLLEEDVPRILERQKERARDAFGD